MKQYHFIGIGGIGMSGLARILLGQKAIVTGSDLANSYVTEGLSRVGAKVFIGHSADYISPEATVIYGSDIKNDNPEYQAAVKLKCPLLHRADLLLLLAKDYKTLAVTGTHGKTTTTALLTTVLKEAGLDPSYAVGGVLPQYQSNADHGKGEYFVAESDESDGTFLRYNPFGAIVTNIDFDHMNHFKTEQALVSAFHQFCRQVTNPELLVWCGDDPRLKQLQLPGISYGFGSHNALRATHWQQEGWLLSIDMEFRGKHYAQVKIALIGRHNVLNALAVFGLALTLGIEESVIRKAFMAFGGVKRRCEKKGDANHILVLDDYAHHPTEVKTTLEGIRSAIGDQRLIVVFQPHRYSRTRDCLGMYGPIFEAADELVMTDIYAAGEAVQSEITPQRLLEEVKQAGTIPFSYIPRKELLSRLFTRLRPYDVVVTLGAGDITKFSAELAEELQKKAPPKLRVGVVYGGKSTEHDVSLSSAKNILDALQAGPYELEHLGISKEGRWIVGPQTMQQLEKREVAEEGPLLSPQVLEQLLTCEVLFPVLHGSYGEDGTIQGLFEMLDKAYVGCDYRASAICMDKVVTKKLAKVEGIPTTEFVSFGRFEWTHSREALENQIKKTLTFPVFVKPSHLGSSVGVYRVDHFAEVAAAVEKVLRLDTTVIVENGVHAPREIEFSVLGNDEVTVFPPGEILTEGKPQTYESKYSQTKGLPVAPKATLSAAQLKEGIELAKRAYRATGCTGMARIDFFVDQKGKFWLNELNTIPGFTPTSMYPKICLANGWKSEKVVTRLIELARQRKRAQNRIKTGYEQ